MNNWNGEDIMEYEINSYNMDEYHTKKYYKEYKCNYQYREFTYNWNIIGERDRYKCPNCYYTGKEDLCCGEGY